MILEREVSQFPLWFPVAMGIGICLYFFLPYEPTILSLISIAAMGGGSGFLLAINQRSLLLKFFGIILLGFCVGIAAIKIRVESLKTPMLSSSIKNISFEGTVLDLEDHPRKPKTKRGIFSIDQEIEGIKNVKLSIPYQHYQGLGIGQKVRIKADLLPLSFPVSLHSMDWRRASFFQSISGTGRLKSVHILSQPSDTKLLSRLRHHLTQKIKQHLSPEMGGIAAALVTGDRSSIHPQTQQMYADAGIAHILAISGLHVSLVIGLIFVFIRRSLALIPWIVLRYDIKRWSAIAALIVGAIYVGISGFGYPAIRAFLMAILVTYGILLGRSPISLRSLALAASVLLLIWPEGLLSASFQLSFSAVLFLVAGYELFVPLLRRIQGKHFFWRFCSYVAALIVSTFLATLATTPFTLFIFQRMTLQGVLGNLLAVPLTSFVIMPLAILSVLSLFLGGVSFLFSWWGSSLSLLTTIAHFVSNLPGAVVSIPKPSSIFLGLSVFGGLWLALWKTSWRWCGILPISLGVVSLFVQRNDPNIFVAGDSSVIAFQEHGILHVSSLKKGKFYWDTWAKEIGAKDVKEWPNPVVQYSVYTLISSPWVKKNQLPHQKEHLCITTINSRLCTNALINKNTLRHRGSCFVWNDSERVQCTGDESQKRPWNSVHD